MPPINRRFVNHRTRLKSRIHSLEQRRSSVLPRITKRMQEDHNVEVTQAFLDLVKDSRNKLSTLIKSYRGLLDRSEQVHDVDISKLVLDVLGSLYELEATLFDGKILDLEIDYTEKAGTPTATVTNKEDKEQERLATESRSRRLFKNKVL